VPNAESEHVAVCPVCGRTYDRRKADEVDLHAGDHVGVEHPSTEIVGTRVGEIEGEAVGAGVGGAADPSRRGR
jgi:hypothetical protein